MKMLTSPSGTILQGLKDFGSRRGRRGHGNGRIDGHGRCWRQTAELGRRGSHVGIHGSSRCGEQMRVSKLVLTQLRDRRRWLGNVRTTSPYLKSPLGGALRRKRPPDLALGRPRDGRAGLRCIANAVRRHRCKGRRRRSRGIIGHIEDRAEGITGHDRRGRVVIHHHRDRGNVARGRAGRQWLRTGRLR